MPRLLFEFLLHAQPNIQVQFEWKHTAPSPDPTINSPEPTGLIVRNHLAVTLARCICIEKERITLN